jgi:chloramphenicol 3-O phosphotransferase
MIVFVNGASSSGKTSLARALQEVWDGPLLFWSIDMVISQLPFALTGKGAKAADGYPTTFIQTREGKDPSIKVGRVGRDLSALSAQYIRQISESGYDVIVDYVLLDEEMYETFRLELADVEVLFVGLTCRLKTLHERERARGDREVGLSASQEEHIHFCKTEYDLVLDSTNDLADALASDILQFIAANEITIGLGRVL